MMKQNSMRKMNLLFAAGAVLLLLADLYTKKAAAAHLAGDPLVLIPGVLELTYLENHGAAFGLLENRIALFAVLTCAFLAAAVWFLRILPGGRRFLPLRAVCFAACAGAAGNLYDRLRFGFVRDFIYLRLIDFPVFNVADICVTCSAAAALILLLFYYKEEDLLFLNHRGRSK